jgi:CheY-like chemotaxis protein
MDVVMPDMDGIHATQILRRELPEPVRHMPVIALTASANPIDRDRCLASGMDDVVHKPLDQAQLIATISAVLAAHEARGHA